MTLVHKDYPICDPALMAPDPANYARDNKLVGVHDPDTRALIGAWRWPLLQHDEVRRIALEWIQAADRIIDFGGAAGGLGYGAVVVDRIGAIRGLEDVDGPVDMIFTSHTLEHVRDLGLVLCMFYLKLAPRGRVIALVPSWRNEKLRAENWPHHAQTFCLRSNEDAPAEYTRLDTEMAGRGLAPTAVGEGFGNLIVFAERVEQK